MMELMAPTSLWMRILEPLQFFFRCFFGYGSRVFQLRALQSGTILHWVVCFVSRCFQNDGFRWKILLKWMIWGTSILWKPPFHTISGYTVLEKISALQAIIQTFRWWMAASRVPPSYQISTQEFPLIKHGNVQIHHLLRILPVKRPLMMLFSLAIFDSWRVGRGKKDDFFRLLNMGLDRHFERNPYHVKRWYHSSFQYIPTISIYVPMISP